MSAGIVQTVLVASIVSVSAIVGMQQLAPGPCRALRSSLARALGRTRHVAFLRTLGHWLQPREAKQGNCGSGLGCSSCGGCGSADPPPTGSTPLRLVPRELPRHR